MPLTLNEGSGGATVQALTDSDGYINPIGVVVYTTHRSTGTGDPDVVQFVDASHGLPVAQQGAWSAEVSQGTAANLLCTASQGGVWEVGIIDSQTIGATQSGTWTVGLSASQTLATLTSITNPVTVAQSTASNLKATVDISAGQSVAVTQATAGNLLCTASQGGSWTVASTQSGTWNVGTVTAVTAVGSITNPVTLGSGTNLAGRISAGSDTSTIYNGTTAVTPKFAKIDASASGDNQVVAAVTGKKIRVLAWSFTANGTVNAKWRSATTDVTGARPLIQYASAGGGYCEVGHFETASGVALNLNLSAAVNCAGSLVYAEI